MCRPDRISAPFHEVIAGDIYMVDCRCGIAVYIHSNQYAQGELRIICIVLLVLYVLFELKNRYKITHFFACMQIICIINEKK